MSARGAGGTGSVTELQIGDSPKALLPPTLCPGTLLLWGPHRPPPPAPGCLFLRPPAVTLPTGCQAAHFTRSWSLTCPGPADGVTHWSLTGSRDADKDAFSSFSDGVSRSGTGPLLWVLGAGSQH